MTRALPAFIALATFAAFSPALRNGFVNWDDTVNFVSNPNYRGLGLAQLRWMFTRFHSAHYMPVSWLTLGADYALWGMRPFGYHLTNILLHCANAVLVYLLGLRLVGGATGALFTALFFSLHPLRVESVAWVTERRDVLSGLFFLLSLRLYIGACDKSARPGLWPSFAAFVLAVFSKVTAVTLPVVLLVLDFYPLKRRAFREKLPFAAVSLLGGTIGLFAQNDHWRTLVPLEELGPLARLGHAAYGLVFYAAKTIAPIGLSPWYDAAILSAPLAALCAASCAAAGWLLWTGRSTRPWALAAGVYYAVTVFPALGIVKSGRQLVADRYSYLPCLAAAFLLGAALRKAKMAPRVVAAAWLIGLSVMTWKMTQVWRDTASLWTYVLSVDPSSPFARQNLALDRLEKGDSLGAVNELREPGPTPDYLRQTEARALNNLAVDLFAQGRTAEARGRFQESLRLDPSLAETHGNLGLLLYRTGDVSGAVSRYEQALKLQPASAETHNNLGIALARQGKLQEAAAHFERALQIDPGHPGARANLGLTRRP